MLLCVAVIYGNGENFLTLSNFSLFFVVILFSGFLLIHNKKKSNLLKSRATNKHLSIETIRTDLFIHADN